MHSITEPNTVDGWGEREISTDREIPPTKKHSSTNHPQAMHLQEALMSGTQHAYLYSIDISKSVHHR